MRPLADRADAGVAREGLARLAVASPFLAFASAHAGSLPAIFAGDRFFGDTLSQSEFVFTHGFAFDAWQRLVASPTPSTLYALSVDTRALNLIDLLFFVMPARVVFPGGLGVAVLHVVLVLLAMLSGYGCARAVGASSRGAALAALLAGTSGMVLRALEWEQLQQALIGPSLFYLAGLWRVLRGERGGFGMLTLGAALSAMVYWLSVVYLSVATLVLVVAHLGVVRRASMARLAGAAIAALIVVAPAAIPVAQFMAGPGARVFTPRPWGSPLALDGVKAAGNSASVAVHLVDSIPLTTLCAPFSGWLLPALPLAIFAAVADRRARPWLFLLVLAGVMALGPTPGMPNPLYLAVDRWYPLASRMYHPNRWMVVGVAGGCVAAALAVDRWGRGGDFVVITLSLAAAIGGPWPMRTAPWPREMVVAFDGCSRVQLATSAPPPSFEQRITTLAAVLWRPVDVGLPRGDPPPSCVVTTPDWPVPMPAPRSAARTVSIPPDTLAGPKTSAFFLFRPPPPATPSRRPQ